MSKKKWECYKTSRGYFLIIKNANELLDVMNTMRNSFTFGKSDTFPEKDHIMIYISSHNVCLADRVGEIWITSVLGEFNIDDYQKVEKTTIDCIGQYW